MQSLNFSSVVKIKKAIWAGETQSEVAQRFAVSQATISRIVQGEQWPDVKWPDGSTGELSAERKSILVENEINERVTKRLRMAYASLSEEQKRTIFPPDAKKHLDELLGDGDLEDGPKRTG